jgi:hypothetical protein
MSERGTQSRSWLRQYATNRKVAGSIPDEVIVFFIDLILPAPLWPWGSTQPLTEMSKGKPARKADNLTANSEPIV